MTRDEFIKLFDGGELEAIEFENSVLSIAREFLPTCALAVLEGGEATPEYWTWLCTQLTDEDEPAD